jgi:hypothetical protein
MDAAALLPKRRLKNVALNVTTQPAASCRTALDIWNARASNSRAMEITSELMRETVAKNFHLRENVLTHSLCIVVRYAPEQ